MPTVPLGPWPRGQDDINDSTSSVFQQGSLVTAKNVDLDNDGWVSRRLGWTDNRAGTAYKSIYPWQDILIVHDNTSLLKVDPSDWSESTLATISTTAAKFVEFQNQLFYTDGTNVGIIDSSVTHSHWGMSVPDTPTLGTTTGDLGAGDYRVALTYEDANGVESGAKQGDTVTLSAVQDITVTHTVGDSNAAFVNIYASRVNQEDLFWVEKVAVGSFPGPYTVDDVEVSDRPLRTQHMIPPPAGDFLFTYKGFIFVAVDNWIFVSQGMVPHLFNARSDVLGFPSAPVAAAGLDSGFYVATGTGLHWISGSDPLNWTNNQVDDAVYAAGSYVIPGGKIPQLETSRLIALFASSDGLVAGLPGGQVVKLTDGRLNLASNPSTAAMTYRESGELRQLLMVLT